MRTGTRMAAVAMVVGLVAVSACGRSSKSSSNTNDTGGNTAAGDFGTMKGVCGPATDKVPNPATSTAKGVTATSIDLGVISDVGFTGRPGLNQELWDASDVFVKWCNSVGGIHGRLLRDVHLDAALTQYKQKINVACATTFALVGGGGVFDDTGQKDRLKCLLPAFPGFITTPLARASTLQWSQVPNQLDHLNIGFQRWLGQQFPNTVHNIGYLTASVGSTVQTKLQLQEAGKALGWSGTYDDQYNALGEATYVPFVTKMRAQGVQGLIFVGEPQVLAKLEQAMAAVNFKPAWIWGGANVYDTSFISALTGPPINTYMPMAITPFEDAGQNTPNGKAMKQYLDLFKQYLPKGKSKSLLAVYSFASWLLFAKAAAGCGANLTKRCLYDQALKINSFDGGGLTAPSNPAADKSTTCFGGVQATATGFKVVDVKPNNGVYNCDPSNVLRLKGDYGKGLTLADVGQSLSNLK